MREAEKVRDRDERSRMDEGKTEKLRKLSIQRFKEAETRAEMVKPMWAGVQEEGNLQGLPSV